MKKEIKELLEILIEDLPVDACGQLDFAKSPYADDQDFRILIQELYDENDKEELVI